MPDRYAPTPDVRYLYYDWKKKGEYYSNTTIRIEDREIQISVSPTGRSVMVFVDGEMIKGKKDTCED